MILKTRLDNDDHYVGGNTKEYIVLHGTGNQNDTDEGNANFFCTGSRGVSAHKFVDSDSCTTVVKDDDCSWHVGDGNGKYGITNKNSLGLEMCCTNGKYSEATMQNAVIVIADWMKKYNIPESKVIRHFDASRKNCPSSLNLDGKWSGWIAFKKRLHDHLNPPKVVQVTYDVKFLQRAIKVSVDGIAGNQTLSACPIIKVGSKGDVVKFVQSKIGATVDGDFGQQSASLMATYQKRKGLVGDGICGQATWKKLLGL